MGKISKKASLLDSKTHISACENKYETEKFLTKIQSEIDLRDEIIEAATSEKMDLEEMRDEYLDERFGLEDLEIGDNLFSLTENKVYEVVKIREERDYVVCQFDGGFNHAVQEDKLGDTFLRIKEVG